MYVFYLFFSVCVPSFKYKLCKTEKILSILSSVEASDSRMMRNTEEVFNKVCFGLEIVRQVGRKYNWELWLLRIVLAKVFFFLGSAPWQTKSILGHHILCSRGHWSYHHHSPIEALSAPSLLPKNRHFTIGKFSHLPAYFCTSRETIFAIEIKMCMIPVISEQILPCETATCKCYFAASRPMSIISSSDKLCLPYCSVSTFTSLSFFLVMTFSRAHFTPHFTHICPSMGNYFIVLNSSTLNVVKCCFNIRKIMPILCLHHVSVFYLRHNFQHVLLDLEPFLIKYFTYWSSVLSG